MNVMAYDRFPNPKLAETLGFQYADWQEVLKKSDVLSLHLPLTTETFHFLNKDTISMMKRGAVVINTARGGLIDSQALTEALMNGQLRGLGWTFWRKKH